MSPRRAKCRNRRRERLSVRSAGTGRDKRLLKLGMSHRAVVVVAVWRARAHDPCRQSFERGVEHAIPCPKVGLSWSAKQALRPFAIPVRRIGDTETRRKVGPIRWRERAGHSTVARKHHAARRAGIDL